MNYWELFPVQYFHFPVKFYSHQFKEQKAHKTCHLQTIWYISKNILPTNFKLLSVLPLQVILPNHGRGSNLLIDSKAVSLPLSLADGLLLTMVLVLPVAIYASYAVSKLKSKMISSSQDNDTNYI